MANLNNASLRKELFLEETKETVKEVKPAEALNNYLELAADMSMPVLKVNDLVSEESTEEKKAGTVFELNQPMKDEPVEEKPQIQKPNEMVNAGARKIADRIEDEVHKFWTSKRIVRELIREINSKNAYCFARYMITISDSGSIMGDVKKYITCNEVKHLTLCMLKQAKESGLVNIAQYSKLKRADSVVTKIWNENPNKKVDNKTFEYINTALEEMFEELTKVF